MRTIEPLQVMNLAKSFGIFFIVASIAWFVTSYVIFADIRISWVILFANIAAGLGLGWWWYKRHYHTVLKYDDLGFELKRGRGPSKHGSWQDVTQVSLVHEGYGRFSVRLYESDGEHIDVPASDLKLPASDFRFEIMDLVTRGSKAGALGT